MRRWGFRVEPPIGEVTDRACAVNGGTVCLRLPENPAADALHASDLSSTPTAAAPSSAGPAWRRPIDPDTGWQPALGPAAWQRTCVSSVLCGAVRSLWRRPAPPQNVWRHPATARADGDAVYVTRAWGPLQAHGVTSVASVAQ